jgi:hypothetical protein
VSAVDKGRILGFDNAHGVHERHHMGQSSPVSRISGDGQTFLPGSRGPQEKL